MYNLPMEEIKREREQGKTLRELADKHNVDLTTIYKRLKKKKKKRKFREFLESDPARKCRFIHLIAEVKEKMNEGGYVKHVKNEYGRRI